jgi:hypothetical protein
MWTEPTPLAYGELLSDSVWNTDAVDNLIYLKSKVDRRVCVQPLLNPTALLYVGNAINLMSIPGDLDGANLVDVDAVIYHTAGSTVSFRVANLTIAQIILSTNITIDPGHYSSYDAATPAVIIPDYDEVNEGTRYRLDCMAAGGGGATGGDIHLAFLLD